jgi:hypothetical protein
LLAQEVVVSVTLGSGASLSRGERLETRAGRVALEVQLDGNVVLRHDGNAVWSTGTSTAARLEMQPDGNLVAYSARGEAVWRSDTASAGAVAVLQDDGNLVVQHERPVWSPPGLLLRPGEAGPSGVLEAVGYLLPGAAVHAPGSSASLVMRRDGRLVFRFGGTVVWEVTGPADSYLAVQSDGNLVVYSALGEPVWQSATVGSGAAVLAVQPDGNLVLYARQVDWSSGTSTRLVTSLRDLAGAFAGSWGNEDGDPAIVAAGPVGMLADVPIDATRELALMLVEQRLYDVPPVFVGPGGQEAGPPLPDLAPVLDRWVADQAVEGRQARVLALDLYRGPRHQDGWTLLAVRELVRAVRAEYPRLSSIVLVGSFPEAAILRRWAWATGYQLADRPGSTDNFRIQRDEPVGDETRTFLQVWPEQVADSSDIVLADLSGNWADLYHREVTVRCLKVLPDRPLTGPPPPGLVVTAPATPKGSTTNSYLNVAATVQDVFYVRQDDIEDPPHLGDDARLEVVVTRNRSPEVFEPGRRLANLVAQPDVSVSRIDASGIALSVDTAIRDGAGNRLLDPGGVPQQVSGLPVGVNAPGLADLVRDEHEERRLLIAYFHRNHEHRHSLPPPPRRVASISSSPDFVEQADAHAQQALAAIPGSVRASVVGGATVRQYVAWFAEDADVRSIHAHASPTDSSFPGAFAPADLDADFGFTAYHWRATEPRTLTPSLAGRDDDQSVDWWVHRSIELHGIRGARGSMVFHSGCNAVSPAGTGTKAHYDDDYGKARLGNAILFFTDAVAVLGRSKTYNDSPDLGAFYTGPGTTVGSGWREIFAADARTADLATPERSADAKRAYCWIVLGDCTLPR